MASLKDLADAAGMDYNEFSAIQHNYVVEKKALLENRIMDTLSQPPSSGPISPAILRLEAEKDEALAREDYLLAQEIKLQLEKEREQGPDSSKDWIQWTKQLSRLHERLGEPYEALSELTSMLDQPPNLNELIAGIIEVGFSSTPAFGPEREFGDILPEVSQLIEDANAEMENQTTQLNKFDTRTQENEEATERCKRKHADAIQHCRALLDDLSC